MSWIIINNSKYFESAYTFIDGSNQGGIIMTSTRDDAKRFETKADAKTVQDKYNLGGSIIPA